MYRVVFPAFLSLCLGACSLGSAKPLSFGSGGDSSSATASKTAVRGSSVGLGGEPTTTRGSANPQVASAVDRAPKGSFDRAPNGALADRDYTATSLEATQARDAINAYRKTQGLKALTLVERFPTTAQSPRIEFEGGGVK